MNIITPNDKDSALERYINLHINECHRDTVSLNEAAMHATRNGWVFREMGEHHPLSAAFVVWRECNAYGKTYYMKRVSR